MQTLYIDVYFLINFTVDLISLYFSSILSKVPTSPKRLISASVAASFSAVLFVLSPERTLIKLLLAASGAIVTAFIGCKRVSGLRRARFFLCFIIFGALIGAGVNFMYGILDRWLYGRLEVAFGAANRRLLLFSLVVLLSIGVFKVIVSFFSDIRCEGSVEIEIRFQGKTQRIEAFVDSGNLAKDPLDMRPVLFIKEGIASALFPEELISLRDPELLDGEIRKRIRLIPINKGGFTRIITGVRVDGVFVLKDGARSELSVTVGIDREGGNYGGFDALMPAAALG